MKKEFKSLNEEISRIKELLSVKKKILGNESLKKNKVPINEILVKSRQLILSYIKQIEKEIQKNIKDSNVKYEYELPKYGDNLRICNLKEEHIKIIEKISKKWEKKLFENNVSIKHGKTDDLITGELRTCYFLRFKTIKTQRVKPQKYVYHNTNSEENRDNILKFGLIPKTNINWKHIDYPPAIFAVNSDDERDIWGGKYLFRIDTTNLKNKWWYDLNFPIGYVSIMTFEPIGPEYLELIDWDDERERRKKLKKNL
jgi:hypothetical protein